MPLYVIERNFAEQLDENDIDDAGIKLVNDDVGVRWVYSFLVGRQEEDVLPLRSAEPRGDPRGGASPRHAGRRDHRGRPVHTKRVTRRRRSQTAPVATRSRRNPA